MKRKFSIITALLCMILLCACHDDYEDRYSFNAFSFDEISEDNSLFDYPGFAENLCVPEDITVIKTDLNDDSESSYGVFKPADLSVKEYKDLYKRIYPASTTKIMTCLLALENLNLEDSVIIPDDITIDVQGSSMAGLNSGDELTVKDLLYALMLPSGNDAAVAVAKIISGSVPDFVNKMNEKAESLGAVKTNFTNPHGLPDENHYSTVYDMYLIFNEACKNSEFCKITSEKEYTVFIKNDAYTNTNGLKEVTWRNTNGFINGKYMLDEDISITAGKTGHTNAAGYCLVLDSVYKDKPVISIIMHADSQDQLYKNMKELIK